MKKIFMLVTALTCSLAVMATDYTGELTVNVAGSVSQQEATISVDENDGKATLNLLNFVFVSGTTKTGVGNIVLSNLEPSEQYGIKTMVAEQKKVTITAGDDPEVSMWLGPMLGQVPVDLTAKYNRQVLNVDLSLTALGMSIGVTFVGSTKLGDLNTDGAINVSDVTSLINMILNN